MLFGLILKLEIMQKEFPRDDKNNNLKVIVALSGGVDSTVAAIEAKKNFSQVEGIFLDFFRQGDLKKRIQKIAEELNLRLTIIDAQEMFQRKVVDYFFNSYQSGLTPNPCVVCNQKIKFGWFFDKARKERDLLVTGHYAWIKKDNSNFFLYRAKNKKQDQSYFLWQLKRAWLKQIWFPLSNLSKEEVIKIARQNGVWKYCQKPSQDFCFLGQMEKGNQPFLNKQSKLFSVYQWKLIEFESGKYLGECLGAFFTLGQRKGFGLGGGPWYLIKIDSRERNLFVTRDKSKLFIQEVLVRHLNWLIDWPAKFPLNLEVKTRSTAQSVLARIIKKESEKLLLIRFREPQLIAPAGQSAVFYRNDQVVGGGIISENSFSSAF